MSSLGRGWAIGLAVATVVSLGLAVDTARSDAGPPVRVGIEAVRRDCPAAGALTSTARIAIVDSGIAPGTAAGRSVVARIDVTGDGALRRAPHGTAMASIVARAAPEAEIVDVRILDEEAVGSVAELVAGIDAAVDAQAQVINLSARMPALTPTVLAAVDRALDAGTVVVVAAGNDGRDLATDETWRALAAAPCLVVVGALDADGGALPGTNRGDGVVEVWAPGRAVATSGTGGEAITTDGTSPATAAVTGALLRG